MWDTTEVYRASVRHKAPWMESGEMTSFYGPYEGPAGKSHAKRRIRDQHGSVIEGKVQRLACVHDGNGPDLQWVDVDE
jgi:hypothetical protein